MKKQGRIFRLPDGKVTECDLEYVEAWSKLAEPMFLERFNLLYDKIYGGGK